MNLARLSVILMVACMSGLALLIIVTVTSTQRHARNQDAIAEVLNLQHRVQAFTAGSASLLLQGADESLWRAYRAESGAIVETLERLGEEFPDARKAVRRIELIVESVRVGLQADAAVFPAGPAFAAPDAVERSRILLQQLFDQSTALNASLGNALGERRESITRDVARIWALLIGAALLFGALCVLAFALMHARLARPARQITATLDRLRAGERQARAQVQGNDELSRLADSLNRALDERDKVEVDLLDQDTKLQQLLQLLEGSEDWSGVIDETYRYVWVNPAYARQHRIDPDKVQDLRLPDVIGQEYFDEVVRPRVERCLKGEPQRFETIRSTPGGQKRRLLARYYPIVMPDRRSRFVGAVITDITDLREKEAEMDRRGHLLDMAGRAARFGAWSVDLESQRVEWSDVVAEIHGMPHGYSPSVEEGISFYAPEDRGRIRERFVACAEHGQPYDEELQFIDANGRRRWVRSVGEPVRDGSGRIVEVHGAFQDISEQKALEHESRQLSDRLATLLESITDGFVAFDRQWRYTYVNATAEELLGKSAEELLGTTVWSQFPGLRGTESERALNHTMDQRTSASAQEFFEPLAAWFDMRTYPWEGGVAAYFRDVTEQHRMIDKLRKQETELRAAGDHLSAALDQRQALINSLPAHIALLDQDGTIVDVNDQWRRFGERNDFNGTEFGVGLNYIEVCERATETSADDAKKAAEGLREILSGQRQTFALEYPCHSPERRRWFRLMINRLAEPARRSEAAAVAMHIDVTELKLAEEKINRLAFEDALTGALSRNGFTATLDERFQRDDLHPRGIIAMIDVVNQHDINDAHGYSVGDQLLTDLAQRLQALVGDSGLTGRTGGDEFVVYAPGEQPADFLKRLQRVVDRPFRLESGNAVVKIELRVGYTEMTSRRGRPEQLVREAELALFEHRRSASLGKGPIGFSEDIKSRSRQRIELTRELRRAIEDEQFELHFQPKVRLTDGRMVSAEALIRWRHPERGLLSPALFVPVAEQSQLIAPIGDWALRESCRQLSEWRASGLEAIPVAVKVSQVQFTVGEFSSRVRAALEAFDVDPSHLSLEITESVFERHSQRLLSEIQKLHEMGVRLSLDDFGTGYSSLLYLKRYPFDEIKIDLGFVQGLPNDRYSRDIVLAVLNLAQALEADVVAEGVETDAIRSELVAMGCKTGQGFYFSMPLESEDFRWLLERRQTLPLAPADRKR